MAGIRCGSVQIRNLLNSTCILRHKRPPAVHAMQTAAEGPQLIDLEKNRCSLCGWRNATSLQDARAYTGFCSTDMYQACNRRARLRTCPNFHSQKFSLWQ